MKVRFIRTVSSTRQAYFRGKSYDVPDTEAAPYVREGFAVADDAEQPAPPPAAAPATFPPVNQASDPPPAVTAAAIAATPATETKAAGEGTPRARPRRKR